MNLLNRLMPDFLRRFNHFLLTNYPNIWATRIHIVLFVGIVIAALLVGISFVLPMFYWEESGIIAYITFVIIFSVLSLIVWVVYLLRFNPFKRFADNNTVRKLGSDITTFSLYVGVILVFCSWPFIPPLVETFRTRQQITYEELVKDIDELNVKIATLEFENYKHDFSDKTAIFLPDSDSLKLDSAEYSYRYDSETNYYLMRDKEGQIAQADSFTKITDSEYVIYTAPDLELVYVYKDPSFLSVRYFRDRKSSSMEVFVQARELNRTGFDKKTYKEDIVKLMRKYDPDRVEYISEYQTVSSAQELNSKYHLAGVNRKANEIQDILSRWKTNNLIIFFHIVAYISIFVSLLVYIYRHTTNPVFFLSFLVAALIAIFTGLFFALSRGDEASGFVVAYLYFFLFAAIAISNLWTHRSKIQGIALNFFILSVPFLPALITATYYSILRKQYNHTKYNSEEYQRLFGNTEWHLMLSEGVGVLLLLVLIEFCFKKLYTKWYALPEE